MKAWVKVYTDWKGGRREVVNVLVDLFTLDNITGFYRCLGYRQFNNGGVSRIDYVSASDIVRIV